MTDLIKRLREHDDPRLYHEADVLMSEAADRIVQLEAQLASTQPKKNLLECALCGADRAKEACRSEKPMACPFLGRAGSPISETAFYVGNADVAYMERMANGTGPAPTSTLFSMDVYQKK